jgi:hypothetical protein
MLKFGLRTFIRTENSCNFQKLCSNKGVPKFSKSVGATSKNSRRQDDEMKQVSN